MYRSLMEQVVRFLDRARKSLDIIHERSPPNGTKLSISAAHNATSVNDTSRVPRSRSVHTVAVAEHMGASSSCASSTTSSASSASSSTSSSSSRFGRAKSVAQISPSSATAAGGATSGLRDFTWSVLRRNDPVHCTPPRTKPPPPPPSMSMSVQDVNKTLMESSMAYRRPKQVELAPDEVPPEKLSQEAFR